MNAEFRKNLAVGRGGAKREVWGMSLHLYSIAPLPHSLTTTLHTTQLPRSNR